MTPDFNLRAATANALAKAKRLQTGHRLSTCASSTSLRQNRLRILPLNRIRRFKST